MVTCTGKQAAARRGPASVSPPTRVATTSTGHMTRTTTPVRLVVVSLVVVSAMLTVLALWPCFFGPFLLDDAADIAENPALLRLWPVWGALQSAHGLPVRPLPYYTFAVNYALHGLEPFGWHATNVVLHLANGLLVGGCVYQTLKAGAARGLFATPTVGVDLWAWAVATFWLVHPLVTQPVAYVYQRIELLGAMAILGALLAFLSSRGSMSLAAVVLISVLGMLCKETAAAIPPVVLLTDWLVLSWRADAPWTKLVEVIGRRAWFYAALFATWGVAATVLWWQAGVYDELIAPAWTPLTYAVNQPRVMLHYVRLAFLPVGQCFDYGWSPTWSLPALAPGIIVLAVVVAAGTWSVARRPLAAYAVLLFFTLLGPSSSVIPVNDLCVEHRMYLPLAVLIAGVGGAVAPWAPASRQGFIALALVVATLAAGVAHARTRVYRSLLAVWTDTVAKSPSNQRALLWLGVALQDAGRPADAFEMFGRTIAVDPEDRQCAKAHAFRAAALGRQGDFEACVREAARAVELRPGLGIGWVNLSRALLELGRVEDAALAGRAAFATTRGDDRVVAAVNLGQIALTQGDLAAARDHCGQALALAPTHPAAVELREKIEQLKVSGAE